jgi:4-amino-4-deoxy-L-arabinose transferase-like glycosyltransferase
MHFPVVDAARVPYSAVMVKKPGTPDAKSRPKPPHFRASLGLAALAFLVRLAGMRWGLPDGVHFFSFHPDEFETAGRAIRILNTGNWDPEFFNDGSLFLYLTTLVSWPLYALQIVQTVTGTHAVGRIVSAVFGAATVLVTERIGRRFLDAKHARWAALVVAIAPGVVLHSTFATVDTTATFFAALAIEAGLHAREKGGWSRYTTFGSRAVWRSALRSGEASGKRLSRS